MSLLALKPGPLALLTSPKLGFSPVKTGCFAF